CGQRRGSHDADLGCLVPGESTLRREIERARKQCIVAELGVRVQRQMRGVERDAPIEQRANAAQVRTAQWLYAAPEEPVMCEQQVGARVHGTLNRSLAYIDGGGDLHDLVSRLHLDAV